MVAQVLGAPTQEINKVTQLKIPLVEQAPPHGYYLCWHHDRWVVANMSMGPRFRIDFDQDRSFLVWQKQRLNPKKDLLARALGLPGREDLRVLDATLGVGTDALHMLALGCQVESWECEPVIAFLLHESVVRSQQGLAQRWKIVAGDARQGLSQDFPVAYLDPMFEEVEKKSLPRKEISFLRSLVRSFDGAELLKDALASPIKRVVVKRPRSGDHLLQKPTNQFFGKLIRYDVYQR